MSNIVNWEHSKLDKQFFPVILFDKGMINITIYNELKSTFPNFSEFKTTNNSQLYRKNIELRTHGTPEHNHNLNVIKSKYPAYYKLFNYLIGDDFKRCIFEQFSSQLMKECGFIGNINEYDVLLQICESTGGYENPFHVDSRKRIVHGLLYFGKDQIVSGGELCLAKHKHLNTLKEYPQYPCLSDLEKIRSFEPNDNFGVFVLSTPNSYHKGNTTKGTRRFLYISIDYTGGNKVAWECGWANKSKPFIDGLRTQQNDGMYEKVQKEISEK